MDTAGDLQEGLRRLFDAGLELALQVQADAMAADGAEARATLAAAFHRVSRGVRQTALLQARLARDAERAGREARAEAAETRKAHTIRRKAVVAKTVERVIEEHLDAEEHFDAYRDLRVRLETEALAEGFLDEPVEAQAARLCRLLELPAPLAERAAGACGRPAPDLPASDDDIGFDATPPPDPPSSA